MLGTARNVAETLAHLGEGHIGQVLDERPRIGFAAMQELSDLVPSPLSADLVLLQQQVLNGEAMPRLIRFIEQFLADDAAAAQRPADLSPSAA